MSKGFIKISLLQVQSEYFLNRKISVSLIADQSIYTIPVQKCPSKFQHQSTFFPLADQLQVKIFENQQTDTRYGYFKIPMAKLYQLPNKNHIINTRCVWIQRSDGKVEGNISAIVKLSIIYLPNATANFVVEIKEGILQRDTQVVGKMDPFVECKVGDVSSQTDVMDQAGKNPVWNQKLSFLLESIPSDIYFTVKDKDMVNDDIVGDRKVNPHQEGWFLQKKQVVQRQVQIEFQSKKAGLLKISTFFLLAE